MRCPKCEGKLAIKDNVRSLHDELFRKRVCEKCGHTLYTVEFEVEANEKFMKEWRKCYRKKNDPETYDCDHYSTKTVREYYPTKFETIEKEVGVCYGTKEIERCNCGGNPKKCDFYPHKRG